MSIFSRKKAVIHQNVIILCGRDGFSKQIVVDVFPPVYEIAEIPPITAYFVEQNETLKAPSFNTRKFFPKEEIKEKGITFIKYIEN